MSKANIIFTNICALLIISLFVCADVSGADPINEIVLSKGMTLTAQTDWATIQITAIAKNKRKYTWDGQSIIVNLIPRQQRWYGSLGLYHPQVRPPHKGVVHMVVEEGQQHFKTIDGAMIWLKRFEEETIYRDDGLVISSRLTGNDSDQKFVDINVWQIFVNGKTLSTYQETGASAKSMESVKEYMQADQFETYKKINLRKHYLGGHKPTKLPGSQNSRITIKH